MIHDSPKVLRASSQHDSVTLEAPVLHNEGDIAVLLVHKQTTNVLRQALYVVHLTLPRGWQVMVITHVPLSQEY